MREFLARASAWFPYVLALVLPLAGLIYGFIQFAAGHRDVGIRLVLLSMFAGLIWTMVLTS